MTEALEPAWLLHRREYGDGGFLADFMGLRSGRFSAVVRGARRKARGGSHVGVLRPFLPLLVAQAGRGELKTLRRIEASQAAIEKVAWFGTPKALARASRWRAWQASCSPINAFRTQPW